MVNNKDWTTIHPGFAQNEYSWSNKTYQQLWEENGFTYEEAKEWITVGLAVEDYELVAYARGKGYSPNNINCEELREGYNDWSKAPNAQEYLDLLYPLAIRKTITELVLNRKNLTGGLVIQGEDWPNLRAIDLDFNKITDLTLLNGEKLTRIIGYDNQLKQVSGLPTSLTELYLGNNNLTDLTIFSPLVNLRELRIGNNKFSDSLAPLANCSKLKILEIHNNQITGYLSPLANCSKLKRLDIRHTNLQEGLEYLPEDLETLRCDNNQFPELAKYKNSYYYNYQSWKENNQELIQILLASDQLVEIQTNLQSFSAKWNKYFTKQRQLPQRQKWIEHAYWVKWISVGGGLSSAALAYKVGLPSEASFSLALSGTFLGGLADYGIKKLQNQEKCLEKYLSNHQRMRDLQEEIIKIKSDYEKLLKIFGDLTLLLIKKPNPTKSPELNQAVKNFENVLQTFPKNLITYNINELEAEEGLTEELNLKFAQSLQENWDKLQASKIIDKLVQECNNYRATMYGLNTNEQADNLTQSIQQLANDNQQRIYQAQISVNPNQRN